MNKTRTLSLLALSTAVVMSSCTKTIMVLPSSAKLAGEDSCCCICQNPDTSGPHLLQVDQTPMVLFGPASAAYANAVMNLRRTNFGSDTSWQARTPGGPIIIIGNSKISHYANPTIGDGYTKFANYPVIFRGISGAALDAYAMFAQDLTHTQIPPKQIILKSGENEFALPTGWTTPYWPGVNSWFTKLNLPIRYSSSAMWIEFAFYNFKNTVVKLRQLYPNATITYVDLDLTPALNTRELAADVAAYNSICRSILANEVGGNVSFLNLDVYLRNLDGTPNAALYNSDGTHLRSTGYNVITPAFQSAFVN